MPTIHDTIARIEQSLAQTDLPSEKRTELEALLKTLRDELSRLADSDADQARSVAGFAAASTHEATRKQTDTGLLDLSLEGLNRSVESLESEYPDLVKTVNTICRFLSNMGI